MARKTTEDLNHAAQAAAAAGMTYGQYQSMRMSTTPDKSIMLDKQPIYEKAFNEYICPGCAHPVAPHTNCGHCGRQ